MASNQIEDIQDSAASASKTDSSAISETTKPSTKSNRFTLRDHGEALRSISMRISQAWEQEVSYGHHFLWFPVAMAFGAAVWFGFARAPSAIAIFLFFLASWLAHTALGNRPFYRYVVFLLAGLATGMTAAQVETMRRSTTILDSEITTRLEGVVLARDVDYRNYWRYTIRLARTSDPVIGRPPETIRLLARADHKPVEIGDAIKGLARMGPPSGPALPGGYDFGFDAYFKGIGAYGYFYGKPLKGDKRTNDYTGAQPVSIMLSRLRETIASRIRAALPADTGALASALAVADRRSISEQTVDALRASGLAHILAISGLHMALVAGTVLLLVRSALSFSPYFVHTRSTRKIAALFALAAATAYLLISGGAVSTQRAWLMFVIFLIAVLTDRMALTLRNVALAAIIIILIQPSAVIGPGFQMSFAATIALISAYSVWSRRSRNNDQASFLSMNRTLEVALQFFLGIAFTSLVAGVSTGLFAVEHFQRIAPYGLLANLAAMPVVTFVVMPFGLVSLIAMPLHLEYWPLQIMGAGLDAVVAIAMQTERLGGDAITGRIASQPFLVALVGFLIHVLMRSWLRFFGAALFIVGIFWGLGAVPGELPEAIISEDGALVGLFYDNGVATNKARPSAFVVDQWKDALDLNFIVKPFIHASDDVPTSTPDKRKRFHTLFQNTDLNKEILFRCAKGAWCAGRTRNGLKIATIEDLSYLGAACDEADIVVAAAHIRMPRCYSGAELLTGRSLRRSGALEIYFLGGDITSVGAINSKFRQWTRHRFYDWRTKSFQQVR
ncbi:ComEC family competence protein [Hoeflea sp. WL0058]|uniref:ComEC family competence protein n=1 Tax=Flavimaribacter sediminis TaxID=2865987 RepID=A0AAE2ZLQ5_9HYPH|nr:ComEC/Rec2 family competence protein [Flavimaribacter sediminis]MBW8636990.1 ComEC family competence protein [Flavimaribacter sediminis]